MREGDAFCVCEESSGSRDAPRIVTHVQEHIEWLHRPKGSSEGGTAGEWGKWGRGPRAGGAEN